MGPRGALTIREMLSVQTHPGHIFWLVMRERYVPDWILQTLAVDLANEFLARAKAVGVYLDFRSWRAIETKQAWINSEVSTGALRVAIDKAALAREEVADLADTHVAAAASIVSEAMDFDAESAFSQTFYSFIERYSMRADRQWVLTQALIRLEQVA